MLGFIVVMIIIGIVAGYLARLLVPGRDPMSFVQTVVLGVVGSFIGGFLGYVLFDKDIGEGALQAVRGRRLGHRRRRGPADLQRRQPPPWRRPPDLTSDD